MSSHGLCTGSQLRQVANANSAAGTSKIRPRPALENSDSTKFDQREDRNAGMGIAFKEGSRWSPVSTQDELNSAVGPCRLCLKYGIRRRETPIEVKRKSLGFLDGRENPGYATEPNWLRSRFLVKQAPQGRWDHINRRDSASRRKAKVVLASAIPA